MIVRSRDGQAASRDGGILRALRHPNYRLFFGGQSVSLIGVWVTRLATSWLVYRITGSAVALGTVAFASQVPTFVLSPFAGVWVDRWNRHRTLVVTQITSMLQSFALATLALGGVIRIWHLVVLGMVQGIVNAFDTPARQSFLIELVEDEPEDSGPVGCMTGGNGRGQRPLAVQRIAPAGQHPSGLAERQQAIRQKDHHRELGRQARPPGAAQRPVQP